MTEDDPFSLFWSIHKERLLTFAVNAACGNWQDAEEGLNDALRELEPKIVEHFEAVSIKDQADAKNSILPLLWRRVKSRVWDARRRSLKHEKPLGGSVLPAEALDDKPAKIGDDSTDAAVDSVAKLVTAMNQLSDTEKKVIKLTILHEPPMTDDETAKEIGTTPGTVKARRCSALRKLRGNGHQSP